MVKKLILSLMTLITVGCASLGLASCFGNKETSSESCEHVNVSETLTAATCTTKGQKSKVCLDCDYVFPAEELPALGHQFGESVEIAATCLSAKVVVQQCGRCNEIVEETIGEALGHDYKLQGERAATCTEPAMNTYKCDRNGCNATKSEAVNGSTALGHNYVHMTEKDVTATCTQAGEEVWECTNDGCEESYCNIVSPLDHLPENEGAVTAPTCTEKGYTSMHCTRPECGEDYTINLVPELGHNLVDGASITASCDTMGYDRQVCDRDGCSYEVRSNVVANTAHTFDNSGVCSGCGKGAMEVFALTCGDTALYSIEKVGDEYIVYAPSYKFYTYVVMPANVLQALYAQGVYSFNVMLGSRTDNVTKAMAFNIQGGQDINVNVLANEMKEMTSYTFADENGILAKDKDGITFGVYYRVMDELTAAIGETQVSAYAISFQYNIAFSSDNVDSYFKTVLPYTYNQESGVYTFTDVNTSGNNTVTLRQELLQYYYDQGYRTLDITLATAIGQHFAKNLTASATGIETLTTGDTNDMTTTLAGIDLESILSSDLKLDIYCSDHYGTAWNPEEPMDSFLLSFKWIMPDPEFDVEDTTTYFKSDLSYTYDEESGVYTFTDVNTSGYNTVVIRQELLQYYLNNGYKTLTIMVNVKAGQHFSKNLTAKYGDGQTATSGDTNMTAVISELSLEALVSGNVTLDLYASDNYGREGFEAFDIVEPMDCFLLTLKFEKEKEPVTAFTSGNGQIADYKDDVEFTASEPVYAENTATITYTLNIVNHTYTFISFDAKIINEMMSKGYKNVQFGISLPSARYISADLSGTGMETITKQYGEVDSVGFDWIALTADGTYNIRFYFGAVTEVTLTVTFAETVVEPEPEPEPEPAKPVTAFTSGNGQIADYKDDVEFTASEPVYAENTATITYTLNIVNHTYTFLNFDAVLVNEMMAQGYTSVTFNISLPSARYISADLNGTDLETITKQYGAVDSVEFDWIALTADGTYNIRFYFGAVTEVTVTAVFAKPAKPVTAFTSGNGQIADYIDDVDVTASEPVYAENTATITYTLNIVNHTYTFLNFDAVLVNEMMAQGYTSVTFNISLPSARYISADLNGTGLETVTKQFGGVANVEFDEFALTADGTYNIRFFFGDVTAVTVTAVFSK